MCFNRRHLPPPRTNFEKLQDILLKRKGMKLDTSSSGALAASLDQCVVCSCIFFILMSRWRSCVTYKTGSGRARVQHFSSHHGYSLYALCRIFLLRQCWKRYIWTLWSGQSDLHSFHKSYPTLCWYVGFFIPQP